MGSDRAKLISRCCYAAVALITLSVMFWAAWCLFGVTVVQVSEGQRRALADYSPAVKPLPTPTTPVPSRSTTLATEETSANSISKLPTTASLRGETKRKEARNGTAIDGPIPAISLETNKESARRAPTPDIVPTKVYEEEEVRSDSESSRRDEIQSSRRSDPETIVREPDFDRENSRRRVSSSARRYDDLDEERGSPGRYDKRDRGRDTDDRYSKGDSRVYPDDRDRSEDRVRERYPEDKAKREDDRDERLRSGDKDSRRYRDEERPLERDDRYRDEERYRTVDDKRYRDRDDERYKSRGDDIYRSRDDDKYRSRDDDRYRSRDDERYRSREDEKYRSRNDERYETRDDDRYRDRTDERYRSQDEDTYRSREDDRYRSREDERYRPLDEDLYRSRDDEKYRSRTDERYKSPEDDRYRFRDDRYRSRDNERYRGDTYSTREDDKYRSRGDDRDRTDVRDEYHSRGDDERYVDTSKTRQRETDTKDTSSRSNSDLLVGERKPTSSRYDYNLRSEETVTDFDIPDKYSSRLHGSSSRYDDEERYRDRSRDYENRRPSRYENDRTEISPTRTREAIPFRSTLINSRPRGTNDDSKYVEDPRDRFRDDDRFEDRIRNTRIQDSRSSLSASENSKRYTDTNHRYRTRLPEEGTEVSKISDRREEVVLDRRSYASEDQENARRGSGQDNDDRIRRPVDYPRRRDGDDERYSRRDPIDREEDDRRRTYDRDRSKSRDIYDEDHRRRDDPRDDDRYYSRGNPPVRRYEIYPNDDREDKLRPSSSARDEYVEPEPPPRRRYDVDSDSRLYADQKSPGTPKRPNEPELGSPTTSYSSDVVVREKRFQNTENKPRDDRRFENGESREQARPLNSKDVIEAAIRHSDASNQNSRKVDYPVFDPRLSNLTSPEIIRPSERRGTTITVRRKRSV